MFRRHNRVSEKTNKERIAEFLKMRKDERTNKAGNSKGCLFVLLSVSKEMRIL